MLPLLAFEAWRNLHAVRQRSALALLGIIIGTASVIAMINIGHNAGQEALRQFKDMGTDVIMAQPPTDSSGASGAYDLAQIRALTQTVTGIDAVAPMVFSSAQIGAKGKASYGTILASEAALRQVARLPMAAGRFISAYDDHQTFAVIGSGLARALALRPGERLRVEDYVFTVIGVLDDTAISPLIPLDFNTAVLIPLGSARRVLSSPDISNVAIRLEADADPVTKAVEIAAYFQAPLRGQTVTVQSARQLIEGMARQSRLFTWLLAAIGGISLLVGGIGVMNVMLMGIMERRREIGVRMAVGARAGDIRVMFLAEAITLSVAGGLAGAILGMAAAWLFALFSGWYFAFSLGAIPLGTGIAAVIGVFFGFYPAVVAARLDPIEALRAD